MLLAVCSLKGSPGVTTFATVLGACWPVGETPIVVEADPAGGDLMARFRLNEAPSLTTLAVRARRGVEAGLLAQHSQQLPGGLHVVIGPVGAEQARTALSVLASGGCSVLRRAAEQPSTTVIVDCGRVDPDSPALPIIRSADAMLLVARPQDAELAHVALKLHEAQRWSRRPGLVLIGQGHPAHEVSRALGIPVMGTIPRDDKGAAVLIGHRTSQRNPAESKLGRAAARVARLAWAQWQANNRPRVVSPRPIASSPLAPLASVQLVGSPTRNGTSA
jgi:hypothetical protein